MATGSSARDVSGPHDDGANDVSVPTAASDGPDCEAALCAAEAAVQRLAGVTVDELADEELESLLSRVRRPLLQLEGVRSRAAAAAVARAASRADRTPLGAAVQDRQRRLAEQQQVTHSEIKQQIAAGRAARDHEATGRAMAEGQVAPRHAQLIAKILADIPPERRAEVEAELLELAGRLEAGAFGRAARELLGRERPQALATDETRQHRARSLRATTTEDGGFAFSGLLYGAAAEQARVAFSAFRRPDTPGERRTPAQRGADAFEQLCAAALRVGDAPTNHGERPQVMVVFTAAEYAALSTSPELTTGRFLGSGQTVTGREVRNLVDDCEMFRLVLDEQAVPMEVSKSVRTVPVGLWRALMLRDGGCVWEGCDAPASWCDVAHGNRSFTRGGKLSLDNSMLLCRRHHRRFDQGSFSVRIEGRQVTIERGEGGLPAVSDSPPPDSPPPGAPPPGAPLADAPPRNSALADSSPPDSAPGAVQPAGPGSPSVPAPSSTWSGSEAAAAASSSGGEPEDPGPDPQPPPPRGRAPDPQPPAVEEVVAREEGVGGSGADPPGPPGSQQLELPGS